MKKNMKKKLILSFILCNTFSMSATAELECPVNEVAIEMSEALLSGLTVFDRVPLSKSCTEKSRKYVRFTSTKETFSETSPE